MANCSCKTPHSSASQEKTMEGQRKTIHKLYIIIPLFCIILVYRFYVCRKLLSHNLGCGTPCGVWGVVCGRSPCCGGVGCGVRCWHHPYRLEHAKHHTRWSYCTSSHRYHRHPQQALRNVVHRKANVGHTTNSILAKKSICDLY